MSKEETVFIATLSFDTLLEREQKMVLIAILSFNTISLDRTNQSGQTLSLNTVSLDRTNQWRSSKSVLVTVENSDTYPTGGWRMVGWWVL